jgi:hypothetical protein
MGPLLLLLVEERVLRFVEQRGFFLLDFSIIHQRLVLAAGLYVGQRNVEKAVVAVKFGVKG